MSESKTLQTIKGTVVKVSSKSTIRITSKVTTMHPLYRKRYSQNRYYIAHDPKNEAKVGDMVTIVACRPISKQKHWVVQ